SHEDDARVARQRTGAAPGRDGRGRAGTDGGGGVDGAHAAVLSGVGAGAVLSAASASGAPASRRLRPVSARNTSSRVGRCTCAVSTGTLAASAARRRRGR